jgi:hypothetical protein
MKQFDQIVQAVREIIQEGLMSQSMNGYQGL